MNGSKYYLRPNVMIEPLFNQWYAWPLLIAPHTAAMNISNLHLTIMKSYVSAPQIHANAVKNPALLGGPFIDYNRNRVSDINALITKTTKEQDRKSTRLNSSHSQISYAVFCLKKKNNKH